MSSINVDRLKKLESLELEVRRVLALGEIDKPAYDSLKYKVDRAVEDVSEIIAEEHLWGKGGAEYRLAPDDKHWAALVSAIPLHYARDLLFLGKRLANVTNEKLKRQALYKDVAAYHARFKGVAEDMLQLKEKVIPTSRRRAEKKVRESQQREQKFTEHKTLVTVLQTHLDAYIARAADLATEAFEYWMTELREANWNIEKAAPEPGLKATAKQIAAMAERRAFLMAITDPAVAHNQLTPKNQLIRKRSVAKKNSYIERQKAAAHAAYMGWIYKMIEKIGKPVTQANMIGDPWLRSTLTVVREDGVRQVWHTKMILNRSKYKRRYNQFPSRQVE